MFSIQIKLLIISVFIGSLVIFFLQNTQVVPLILFGSTIANLPVGILILGSVFSGLLTSFILQLFNQGKTQVSPQFSPEQTNRNTPNYSRSPRQSERSSPREERREERNIKNYQEQNIKDSPKTQIQDNINKPISDTETLETKQDTVKKDTVYSYSYRKQKDKGVNKTDDVYDANYRVIVPPYQSNQEQSLEDKNEDEDWV